MSEQDSQIDHRNALVRLLRHHSIDQDGFDSALFHFDQAVELALAQGKEQREGES